MKNLYMSSIDDKLLFSNTQFIVNKFPYDAAIENENTIYLFLNLLTPFFCDPPLDLGFPTLLL